MFTEFFVLGVCGRRGRTGGGVWGVKEENVDEGNKKKKKQGHSISKWDVKEAKTEKNGKKRMCKDRRRIK